MLRQGDAQVFKKYSQMKPQMKREALEKLNRHANEMPAQKAGELAKSRCAYCHGDRAMSTILTRFCHGFGQKSMVRGGKKVWKCFRINSADPVGA
jgi:hypothetical protein